MSWSDTEETRQFSFAPFAAHPFYTHINRSLVHQALASTRRPTTDTLTIVDMACGTGAITQLIAEEVALRGYQARILGVDPSAEALRFAQQQIEGTKATAEFIRGDTEDLPHLVQQADAAFFCNAIHLVPDKLSALRHLDAILAPGGTFACNSAFYEGTSVAATLRFGRLWVRRAVGWLHTEHPEVQLARQAKATAMQWLTPDAYVSLLAQAGLDRIDVKQEQVMMSLDGLRDLGHYWLFIEGALPGAPLALGAAALGAAVYQAGQELGMTEVPRLWLQIIARKA